MLEQMKAKIEELSQKVEHAAAQHNFFLGALTALKEAVAIGQAIDPESPLTKAGESILDAIEDLEQPHQENAE